MKSLLFLPICLVFFFASCGGEMIEVEDRKLESLCTYIIDHEIEDPQDTGIRFYDNYLYAWNSNKTQTGAILNKISIDCDSIYRTTIDEFTYFNIGFYDQTAILLDFNKYGYVDLNSGELYESNKSGTSLLPNLSSSLKESIYFTVEKEEKKEYEIQRRKRDNFGNPESVGTISLDESLYYFIRPLNFKEYESGGRTYLTYIETIENKSFESDYFINLVFYDLDNSQVTKKIQISDYLNDRARDNNTLFLDNKLYIGLSDRLHCIDLDNQIVLWSHDENFPALSFPDKKPIFYSETQNLIIKPVSYNMFIAYDADSGQKKWENFDQEFHNSWSYEYYDNKIYYATNDGVGVTSAATGDKIIHYTFSGEEDVLSLKEYDKVIINPELNRVFLLHENEITVVEMK